MLATKLLMLPVLIILSILVADNAFSISRVTLNIILPKRSKGIVVIRSFKKLKEMK